MFGGIALARGIDGDGDDECSVIAGNYILEICDTTCFS